MSLMTKIITALETQKEKRAKAETIAMKAAREYILRPDIDNLYDSTTEADAKAEAERAELEAYEEAEVFCDVCGLNYPEEDPCQYH
jgi:hypothetical protein